MVIVLWCLGICQCLWPTMIDNHHLALPELMITTLLSLLYKIALQVPPSSSRSMQRQAHLHSQCYYYKVDRCLARPCQQWYNAIPYDLIHYNAAPSTPALSILLWWHCLGGSRISDDEHWGRLAPPIWMNFRKNSERLELVMMTEEVTLTKFHNLTASCSTVTAFLASQRPRLTLKTVCHQSISISIHIWRTRPTMIWYDGVWRWKPGRGERCEPWSSPGMTPTVSWGAKMTPAVSWGTKSQYSPSLILELLLGWRPDEGPVLGKLCGNAL